MKTMSVRKAAEIMGRSLSSVKRAMDRYQIKGVPQHLWYSILTEEEKAARRTKLVNSAPRIYGTQEEGKRQRQRRRLRELHMSIAEALGGACVVCGEVELILLEVDHINDDGAEHRRTVGRGIPYYKELLRVALEESGRIQLMCSNDHLRKTRLAAGWGEPIEASADSLNVVSGPATTD